MENDHYHKKETSWLAQSIVPVFMMVVADHQAGRIARFKLSFTSLPTPCVHHFGQMDNNSAKCNYKTFLLLMKRFSYIRML